MKKTMIAVACAALISTGAYAKPASNHAPKPHNNPAPTHTMNHHAKPAVHAHTGHHNPIPYVAHVHHTPAPVYHHHHHSGLDLGDALIAFAILATAF